MGVILAPSTRPMRRLKLIIFFSIVSISISANCFGQDQTNSSEDNNDIILLLQQAETETKSDKIEELSNKALSLLSTRPNQSLTAKANQLLGKASWLKNQHSSAIEYFTKSVKIYQETNDSSELARSLNFIGVCYQQRGQYSKALDYLHKSLLLREKLKDKTQYAGTLNNLGIVYRLTGQLDLALSCYNKAHEIFKQVDNKQGYSTLESNIGLIYNQQGNFQEALLWFLKALETKKELKDTSSLADNYENLGWSHYKFSNYSKALEYTLEANRLFKLLNNTRGLAKNNVNLASIYLKTGNLQNALHHLNISKQIAESTEDNAILREVYKRFSEYYLATGNFSKSKEMLELYSEVVDKTFSAQVSQEIAEISVMYETTQKEYQNNLLQANLEIEKIKLDRSKDIQRFSILISLVVIVLLIYTLILINKLRKNKREIERINKDLHNLNADLEKKVEKRTMELSDALIKAEESDSLKSAFLSNMSHEVRTPMNGIIGFAKILEDDSLSQEERKGYIDIINRQGQNLLQIINDIISISKIESGQITINKSICNVNVILSDLYFMFDAKNFPNQTSKVELRIVKSLSDNRSSILTDPIRLEQILMNLIDNALKFTSEGYVEFGYSVDSPREIKFFVKDTGIGIPLHQLERIFNRFYRYSNNERSLSSGTGLGLSISKALSQLLGGELTVESKVGVGSTFTLTIPYIPIDSTLIKSKNEQIISNISNKWSDKLILVVEDDLISYLYLETLLIKSGANLIHVKNGEDAIEVCRINDRIDLILMDMQLPFISGYEATKEIKSFRYNIPIIAQTANVMNNERERCIKAGCNDYISKPIDPDEFMLILTKYFNQQY